MSKKSDRDDDVTDALLKGETLSAVSVKFDLHPVYVHRIFMTVCRQRNPVKIAEISKSAWPSRDILTSMAKDFAKPV
jgi:hypothetical protein